MENVTERALIQRINRKLKPLGKRLAKARVGHWGIGPYYVTEVARGRRFSEAEPAFAFAQLRELAAELDDIWRDLKRLASASERTASEDLGELDGLLSEPLFGQAA